MSKCLTILRKDVYRLRAWICLWLVGIGIQLLMAGQGTVWSSYSLESSDLVQLLIQTLNLLQYALIIVVMPLLIQEDAVVGAQAFWLTRPISAQGLLKAKFIFLGFIVSSFVSAELIILFSYGFSGKYLFLALIEALLEKSVAVLALFVLAMLTKGFSHYALLGIFLSFSYFFIFFWGNQSLIFLLKRDYGNVSTLAFSRHVIQQCILIILALAVIHLQYNRRRTNQTIKFIVLAGIVVFSVGILWPWDFLKDEKRNRVKNNIAPEFKVAIDMNDATVQKDWHSKKYGRSIEAKLYVVGLGAAQFARLSDLQQAHMRYNDGTIVSSQRIPVFSIWMSEKFMPALQQALGEYHLLNPFKKDLTRQEIFNIDNNNYETYQGIMGTYGVKALFDIYEYRKSASLPLSARTYAALPAEKLSIIDVFKTPMGVELVLEEKKINLLLDTENPHRSVLDQTPLSFKYVYVLVNKTRKEALLTDSLAFHMLRFYGFWPMSYRLFYTQYHLRFNPVKDGNGEFSAFDDSWLKDAELIRLDAEKIGVQEKEILYKNFYLPARLNAHTR